MPRLWQRARDAAIKREREREREREYITYALYTHVQRDTKLIARARTAIHFDEAATNVIPYICCKIQSTLMRI